jgi:uncharacterized protein YcgI (DUF1989 family)
MVVNFFSKVSVDNNGQFSFHSGHSQPGSYVELFAPMDVLVVLTALQHPMDPSTEYAPRPVRSAGDRRRTRRRPLTLLSRPENDRAFTNTQLFAL